MDLNCGSIIKHAFLRFTVKHQNRASSKRVHDTRLVQGSFPFNDARPVSLRQVKVSACRTFALRFSSGFSAPSRSPLAWR